MKFIYIISFTLFFTNCSVIKHNRDIRYFKLVFNTSEYLRMAGVVENNCTSHSDTIFINVKDKNQLVGKYIYINKNLTAVNIDKSFNEVPRSNVVCYHLDKFNSFHEIEFNYYCIGKVNGTVFFDKKNIKPVHYKSITTSH